MHLTLDEHVNYELAEDREARDTIICFLLLSKVEHCVHVYLDLLLKRKRPYQKHK
jgi:hypothetical protein